MPFKSRAQRRKFAELLVKGEISEETYENWNRETGKKELPEYASKKKTSTGKKRATAKRKKTKRATTKRKAATKRRTTAKRKR